MQTEKLLLPRWIIPLEATLKFWRTMAWRLKTEELPR